MDLVLILLAIGWTILSAANNKKKKREAEERKGQQTVLSGSAPAGQTVQSVPAAPPSPRPQTKAFDPYAPEPEVPAQTAPIRQPVTAAATVQSVSQMSQAPSHRNVAPPESRIKESVRTQSAQHPLEASSISGHAHEETSIAGFQPCPPQQRLAPRHTAPAAPSQASAPATGNSFCWDPAAVRSGILMAEILGKPKALRRGRP